MQCVHLPCLYDCTYAQSTRDKIYKALTAQSQHKVVDNVRKVSEDLTSALAVCADLCTEHCVQNIYEI